MTEDKLNPEKDNLVPKGARHGRFPFNNKGFAGDAGGGDGDGGSDGDDGGAGGAGDGGAGAATLDWRATLDPSIREHPSLANFKTPADVAKSYVNAQSLIGKEKLPVPGKDADPMAEGGNEEYNVVYDRLGRPSDPKAYEIPQVEMPQGMPAIPQETIDGFKEFSHKIGLLPHQVKALYQYQHDLAINGIKENSAGTAQALQKSEGELRKEYGKAFDGNLAAAKGLISKFGNEQVLAALESSGLGNNPDMIRFMVNVAKNFGEDGNVLVGETQAAVLSPQEAKAEIDKIMADKKGAYWNNPGDKGIKPFSISEHNAMVKKVADLNAMAYPGQK